MLFPTRNITRLSFTKVPTAEQVITVPFRSVDVLSVDFMETSGKGELSFNDLETFRVVKAIDIGEVAITFPTRERSLINVLCSRTGSL